MSMGFKARWVKSVFRALVIGAVLPVLGLMAKESGEDTRYPPAVDFPAGVDWFNVSRPLTLKDLHGRVVVLDFWTYGCINCIHVLADLKRLEAKYGDDLLVVGIHTPKFDNEKNPSTLRRIIVRYGIRHPVVNDSHYVLAQIYGMRAWPTQVVIDPDGRVLGKVVGEDNYTVLDKVIAEQLKQRGSQRKLAQIPIALEKEKFSTSLLAAPGKVSVSAQYVAIADTLHNRIVVTDHHGRVQQIYGDGRPGLRDGSAATARFRAPQGMAFLGGKLYVADTGNHVIRQLDLPDASSHASTIDVTTVAGNGSHKLHRRAQFGATAIGLRSPWALAGDKSSLYIAMAGAHQIWKLDLAHQRIRPFAGDGREGLRDGDLQVASFSQPSGLALIGAHLFVADAEDSAVRRIDLKRKRVSTLVGQGLFDFGDEDGRFSEALLQHVLGIAAISTQQIYIADTYNHKIKKLDRVHEIVETVVGTGRPGKGLGAGLRSALNEPGGLAIFEGGLLIADTNNDRLVYYDFDSRELTDWPVTFGLVGANMM